MTTCAPDVHEILRCRACDSIHPLAPEPNGSIRCGSCRALYPARDGFLDMCPSFEESVTPIQMLCESRPMIAIYDHIWRPFGYFFTSSRSFSEDLERITALVQPGRRDRILDLGCGPGNFTRLIARQGPEAQVVGFDLAERMLARAAHLSSGPQFENASYLRGNALEMPFESNTFDAVICCAALHLFKDYDQALSEVSRVLRAGGEFVCQTIVTPPSTPVWLRFADRVFRFGYFELDELKARLEDLDLEIVGEESSKVSYIFRARKRRESRPLAASSGQYETRATPSTNSTRSTPQGRSNGASRSTSG